ncbi:uncharacterized protein B0H64DRAFT_454157 [Chaetomium fimeti]|uniref:Uncharacterized protein n=1 Tax=Chaetomium fimeti TaxID=1854472 RepID=A0AAE0HLE9_9PEZI|nr:hypothetical protein B0H64DRAFT_454157 [Chaetomium fimeti]
MVSSGRKTDKVFWKGQEFRPQLGASDQPSVRAILHNRLMGQALDIRISESELLSIVQIYPRLYQLGQRSRARLSAWMLHNRDTVQGWNLGDFLNTPDADVCHHTVPRKPGCPEEVMAAWRRSLPKGRQPGELIEVEIQEVPANGSGNHDANPELGPLTTRVIQRRTLPQTKRLRGKNCQSPIQRLEGSLRIIKAVASRLDFLSHGLDDNNSMKEELLALARTLDHNVDKKRRAETARALLQKLNKAAVPDTHGKKRGHDQIEGAEGDEDRVQKRVRTWLLGTVGHLEAEEDGTSEDGTSNSSSDDGTVSQGSRNSEDDDRVEGCIFVAPNPYLAPCSQEESGSED